jgi:membrane protease YdiL (CAAX protease family)
MSVQAVAGDLRRPSASFAVAVFFVIFFCKLLLVQWWEAQPILIELIQQVCVIGLMVYLGGGLRALGLTKGKGGYAIFKATALSFGLMAITSSGLLHLAILTGWGITSPIGIRAGIASASIGFRLVSVAVMTPLEEEFLVRGYLLPALLRSSIGPLAAAVITSFLWSASHVGAPWYSLISAFVAGLLLSYARLSSDSLWPCIVTHGLYNATPIVAMIVWPMFGGL